MQTNISVGWWVLILLLVCTSCQQNPKVKIPTGSGAKISTLIDSLVITEMRKRQIPGMSLAIIQDGEVIHKKVYGLSVVEHEVPVKLETTYEMASLTKQFVAAAILLLVEDGKLDLDYPIKNYLDSLPNKWQNLTLRRLLSHTAGLAPQESEYQDANKNWPKNATKEFMWNSAVNDSMIAQPGVVFRYQNVGYFLAEIIIEKISGMPYRIFFQTRIFDPLKLNHTYFEDQKRVVPNQAQGYTLFQGELIRIWRVSQEEYAGGWGIYSNIVDMIKWNYALDHHQLLSPHIQKEMFSKIKMNDGSKFHYGLGWYIPTRYGLDYYWHNGLTGPEILKIPSKDLTVISLTNFGYGLGSIASNEPNPFGIADLIVSELVSEFKFKPKEVSMDESILKQYVGEFSFNYDAKVNFSLEGDRLVINDIYGSDTMIHVGNSVFTFEFVPPVYYHFISPDSVQVTEETWENDFAIRRNRKQGI